MMDAVTYVREVCCTLKKMCTFARLISLKLSKMYIYLLTVPM